MFLIVSLKSEMLWGGGGGGGWSFEQFAVRIGKY